MTTIIPFNGDAVTVFKKVARHKGVFFLDSSLKSKDSSTSFIGFDPIKVVTGNNLSQMRGFIALQKKYKAIAVGYVGYEGHFHFGLYTTWASIDHHQGLIHLHAKDVNSMRQFKHDLIDGKPAIPEIIPQQFKPTSNFNKTTYMAGVKQALAAIKRGDLYQINLSRAVNASIKVDPLMLYVSLREHSPSPFCAYYDTGDRSIISSSPERFLKLRGRTLEVKPMKGTRPRGKTVSEDRRMELDLKGSAKEIAELLMVTDLERNDLGRVCEVGSVKVQALRTIERYATVFQATATVTGKLREGLDAVDAIEATFPSGSVTGCPKISAIKMIKKIERKSRGFYTGALGYIMPNGDMDLSVLIRSIEVKPNHVRYHVGGGIVADSKPSAEYAETLLKAKAIEQAIKEASHG